jgi:hypothetical protein
MPTGPVKRLRLIRQAYLIELKKEGKPKNQQKKTAMKNLPKHIIVPRQIFYLSYSIRRFDHSPE